MLLFDASNLFGRLTIAVGHVATVIAILKKSRSTQATARKRRVDMAPGESDTKGHAVEVNVLWTIGGDFATDATETTPSLTRDAPVEKVLSTLRFQSDSQSGALPTGPNLYW